MDAARAELHFARKAVEQMRSATDVKELDLLWKEFLGRTTRVWNKTEAALKGDPKFYNSPHVKRVKLAQKQDELIRYLARARDADEHTAEQITHEIPAGPEYVVNGPNGETVMTIRSPRITVEGKTVPLSVRGFTASRFAPAEVFAVPVTTRGQTVQIPAIHQGSPIGEKTLLRFAELGLAYYVQLLDDLERDGWDAAPTLTP